MGTLRLNQVLYRYPTLSTHTRTYNCGHTPCTYCRCTHTHAYTHTLQPKLKFTLNKETGLPNGCDVYVQKASNRYDHCTLRMYMCVIHDLLHFCLSLIEEFMLLANMAVAHKIWRAFPEKAMLRRHPPPKEKSAQFLVRQ